MRFFLNQRENIISSMPQGIPPILVRYGLSVYSLDYEYARYKDAALSNKELRGLLASTPGNSRSLEISGKLTVIWTAALILCNSGLIAATILFLLEKYAKPAMTLSIVLLCIGLPMCKILEKSIKRILHTMADNYNADLLRIDAEEYPELIRYNDKVSPRAYCLFNKTPLTRAEAYARIAPIPDNKKNARLIRLTRIVLWGIALFLAGFTGASIICKTFLDCVSFAIYIGAFILAKSVIELQTYLIEQCVDTYNITLTQKKWNSQTRRRV
jgi:hypothetical protein